MKVQMWFTMDRVTKNTYRFQEEPEPGHPPRIGTLYVQKWVFKDTPKKIKVELEVEEKD